VLDGFEAAHVAHSEREISRVVVTLGTWSQTFRSLLERLVELLPPEVETVWQTGATDVLGLPIRAMPWIAPDELAIALREADLVVTHAGMGAALDALEAGKCPVVVPRRKAAGEQIDDHQVELGTELERRGLAIACAPSELTYDVLATAASRSVAPTPLPDFELSS
jgi:UDP-N-acetylglucosamine transferase subunit ALG13